MNERAYIKMPFAYFDDSKNPYKRGKNGFK